MEEFLHNTKYTAKENKYFSDKAEEAVPSLHKKPKYISINHIDWEDPYDLSITLRGMNNVAN